MSSSKAIDRGASRARGQRLTLKSREAITGYLFLAPNLIGFLAFTAFPVAMSFALGFLEWDLLSPPRFVGLGNYARLFAEDRLFLKVMWNTVYYTLGSVPLGFMGSLGLALAMNQRLRGIVFFRTAFFVPVVSSGVAIAMLWIWLYHPYFGLVNGFLDVIGVRGPGWLADPRWALPAIIFMSVWKSVGYNMVIFLAGLQGIPQHLYEAAEIDGAGRLARFRYVTIPMLTPTMFFVVVMSIIGSFQVFEASLIMTNGGPADATRTLVLYIYNNAFQYFKMGYGAAMAWVLFAILFLATTVQMRLQREWVQYE